MSAIEKELIHRKNELKGYQLESIYFGGGTPSLLSINQLHSLTTQIERHYNVCEAAEFTLEANPEDLTYDYCTALKALGVNRLSIGIQSFRSEDIDWMNRAHTISHALSALEHVNSIGFDSYTIDLMFGLIATNVRDWQNQLKDVLRYRPPHISCYNLTVEEQTVLAHKIRKEKLQLPPDEMQFRQFMTIHNTLTEAGYDHYEISNYALQGHHSLHNRNYWNRKKYLGIGPGAHSFDGQSRRWNIANNAFYIKSIETGHPLFEEERLSEDDVFNEKVMLGLRTKKGIHKSIFQTKAIQNNIEIQISLRDLLKQRILIESEEHYHLTVEKWYLTDHLASMLFV